VAARELAVVEDFLQRGRHASRRTRERLRRELPIPEIRVAALEHPDPWIRRLCLGILDHEASDESAEVFAAALRDPVAPVREVALHGLSCERCRSEELPVADVAPLVIDAFERETSVDVRCRLLAILLQLSDRSPAAHAAIARTAETEDDPLVKEAAVVALRRGRALNPEDLRRRARTRRAKAARRTPSV
jgi:hypothetical protein